MAQYGYMSPQNGYKPPGKQKLASTLGAPGATSSQDPFGLAAAAAGKVKATPPVSGPGTGWAPSAPSMGAFPGTPAAKAPAQTPPPQAPATPTAAGVNHYSLDTDPALQQITALTGMSDEQAQSTARQQRYNQALAYGDAGLAEAALPGDQGLALAAAQNPNSTLKQLGAQRSHNITDLTEGLNKGNLLYSGYRVNQEAQAASDYRAQLAAAAAGVNSNLDTITGNLNQTLNANLAQQIQAKNEAAQRVAQQQAAADWAAALAAAKVPGAAAAGGGGGGEDPYDPNSFIPDPSKTGGGGGGTAPNQAGAFAPLVIPGLVNAGTAGSPLLGPPAPPPRIPGLANAGTLGSALLGPPAPPPKPPPPGPNSYSIPQPKTQQATMAALIRALSGGR